MARLARARLARARLLRPTVVALTIARQLATNIIALVSRAQGAPDPSQAIVAKS